MNNLLVKGWEWLEAESGVFGRYLHYHTINYSYELEQKFEGDNSFDGKYMDYLIRDKYLSK